MLLWGNADAISPVAVGARLAQLLPQTRMQVIDAGAHDFANAKAADVAALIDEHLARADRKLELPRRGR